MELRAGPLDARLHARQGQPDDLGGLDLGELPEVGERERLTVWLGQPQDQRCKAAGEFLARAVPRLLLGADVRVDPRDELVGRFRGLLGGRARAVVVDDRALRAIR